MKVVWLSCSNLRSKANLVWGRLCSR